MARPQSGEKASQSELLLNKPDKSAFVVFALMDRQKKELSPGWRMVSAGWKGILDGLVKEIAGNLGIGVETQFALTGQQLPATTIQLMSESSDVMTETQREEFRSIYDEVRKRLLAGQRWK